VLLVCVHFAVQFALLPLLVSDSFLAMLLSNTLYLASWLGYAYITVLGYMSTLNCLLYCFASTTEFGTCLGSPPVPAQDQHVVHTRIRLGGGVRVCSDSGLQHDAHLAGLVPCTVKEVFGR
jgi:hypothetical protein